MMSSLRAEMESSFDEFKRNSEVEKQGMEDKLQETLMQWEALQSRKADMEAKVGFLGWHSRRLLLGSTNWSRWSMK